MLSKQQRKLFEYMKPLNKLHSLDQIVERINEGSPRLSVAINLKTMEKSGYVESVMDGQVQKYRISLSGYKALNDDLGPQEAETRYRRLMAS